MTHENQPETPSIQEKRVYGPKMASTGDAESKPSKPSKPSYQKYAPYTMGGLLTHTNNENNLVPNELVDDEEDLETTVLNTRENLKNKLKTGMDQYLEILNKKRERLQELQQRQEQEQEKELQELKQTNSLKEHQKLEKLEKIEKQLDKRIKQNRVNLLTDALLDALLGDNDEKIPAFKAWVNLLQIKRPDLVFNMLSRLIPASIEQENQKGIKQAPAPIIIFNNAINSKNPQTINRQLRTIANNIDPEVMQDSIPFKQAN